MKISILAIAALVLAGAPFTGAQEPADTVSEQPPVTAAEPSPSPTPDTAVSIPTQKNASPTPKPAASPAKASSPAEPAKAASPAAAMPGKKMSVEASLREMENRWTASIPTRDTAVAQELLADDYMGVTSKGKIVNKKGLLSEIKKDKDTYTSAKNGKMDVRVFGAAAVVTGTSKEKGKDKDGKEFDRTYRWTDTWLQRNGRWQCVASQSMLVK